MPVPISTTARAWISVARNRSVAPPPEPIGTTPTSSARPRALCRGSSSGTNSSAYAQLSGEIGVVMARSLIELPDRTVTAA